MLRLLTEIPGLTLILNPVNERVFEQRLCCCRLRLCSPPSLPPRRRGLTEMAQLFTLRASSSCSTGSLSALFKTQFLYSFLMKCIQLPLSFVSPKMEKNWPKWPKGPKAGLTPKPGSIFKSSKHNGRKRHAIPSENSKALDRRHHIGKMVETSRRASTRGVP